jgi:hypothetical protein
MSSAPRQPRLVEDQHDRGFERTESSMETRHESTSALLRKSVNSIEAHVHSFLRDMTCERRTCVEVDLRDLRLQGRLVRMVEEG